MVGRRRAAVVAGAVVALAPAIPACIAANEENRLGPPFVQLMNWPMVTVYVDTSRMAPAPMDGQRLWLRFDYREPQPDTVYGTQFVRMEWEVELRCARGELRDHGLLTFDSAGTALVKGEPATQGWRRLDEHPIGDQIPRLACERLDRLGRASSAP